ncbi:MAG: thioredoxin [Lachnospiraceae bacterium]|nr:thioredoxin [Lachnospiraceae bacterium]
MAAVVITEANFEEEVLKSDKTVLVDFWASWCGPCKMLSPIVDEIADENSSIKVGKVNVDEEGDLAGKYNIMSIPTLLIFKDGKLVNQSVGVVPKQAILDMVSKA